MSGTEIENLAGAPAPRVRMVIRSKQTTGVTSIVFGETGPIDAPVLLISAHHEASPNCPGALDDASGVGVLLAIAEHLSKTPVDVRLRFATFGGHEFGIYNSSRYVKEHADEIVNLKRQLNLDGAGCVGSCPALCVFGPSALVERTRTVVKNLPKIEVGAGEGRGIGDAVPFIALGIETVWPRNSRHNDEFPLHSPKDDMSWVDRDAMAKYVEVGVALLTDWLREFGLS